LKWICGYANAYGGTIYIGTDDDGNVVGIDNARDLLERIPNKITDTMGIIADVNLLYNTIRGFIQGFCLHIRRCIAGKAFWWHRKNSN
jgi:ATP-dependent DNA helicase RecG